MQERLIASGVERRPGAAIIRAFQDPALRITTGLVVCGGDRVANDGGRGACLKLKPRGVAEREVLGPDVVVGEAAIALVAGRVVLVGVAAGLVGDVGHAGGNRRARGHLRRQVARNSGGVLGSQPIDVAGVVGEVHVRVAGRVRRQRELLIGFPVVAAHENEVAFIARSVGPGQVHLAAARGGGSQIGGRVRGASWQGSEQPPLANLGHEIGNVGRDVQPIEEVRGAVRNAVGLGLVVAREGLIDLSRAQLNPVEAVIRRLQRPIARVRRAAVTRRDGVAGHHGGTVCLKLQLVPVVIDGGDVERSVVGSQIHVLRGE
ncbi:MAG: hypothetical protein QM756_09805 [Polyangiaceae bacterium]